MAPAGEGEAWAVPGRREAPAEASSPSGERPGCLLSPQDQGSPQAPGLPSPAASWPRACNLNASGKVGFGA